MYGTVWAVVGSQRVRLANRYSGAWEDLQRERRGRKWRCLEGALR